MDQASTKPGITIFCPVYNEEALVVRNTLRLLSFLHRTFPAGSFDVILASNGSDDRTVPLIEGLCRDYPELSFFHLPEKGVGTAFAEGVRRSSRQLFMTVDMDLSHDLSFLPRAAELLARCDMVIGSKITGDQKRPFLRKAVSNLFIILARLLLGIGFHDYSIAAKAYRTDMARKYLAYTDRQTFYVIRIAYEAVREGRRLSEIPVDCHDMRGSRFNLMHEGVYKFGNLFLLWFRELVSGRLFRKGGR
ncbi:MAG: glycosyltransferase family 2 protein [Thermodesulfobacteriota bacterium]